MESTLLKLSGWIGARVTEDDGETLALFRSGAAAGTSAVEGFTTDAERFAAFTDKQGSLSRFFLRGSVLEKGSSAFIFKSAKPVAASVAYTREGCDLEVNSDSDTEILLTLEKAPNTVSVNGKTTGEFKYDQASRQFRITVPSGQAIVTIR